MSRRRDARLVALDARNGKLVWDVAVADREKGFTNTSGPIVINGKVLQGLARCERFGPERCYISAYDAATGKQVWKFHTVAESGERNGDTWGNVENRFRKGGETWITGSYDPDLNLTYWGVAQAKPWVAASRNMRTSDRALYTSSTVALRPDTGTLEWFYQHSPGESLDLDEVYERVLIDVGGAQVRLHDRQARHPVEARSRERRVRLAQGDGVPQRVRPHRPRIRRTALPAGDHQREGRRVGGRRVRAPKAGTTGTPPATTLAPAC